MLPKGSGSMDNKRNFFRVDFYDIDFDIFINGLTYHAQLRDISGNGVSFYLNENINFRNCSIKLTLNDFTYKINAYLVRKREFHQERFIYACKFLDLDEKLESKLTSSLLKIEALRRK